MEGGDVPYDSVIAADRRELLGRDVLFFHGLLLYGIICTILFYFMGLGTSVYFFLMHYVYNSSSRVGRCTSTAGFVRAGSRYFTAIAV